jgi:FkbM family methyltransferase
MDEDEEEDKNLCPQIILLLIFIIFDIFLFRRSHLSKWPNTYYNTPIIIRDLYNFHIFSEYYEDLILYLILFDIKKGFYIDVGAYDPIKVSVTKSFYLKGWRGINIEPQPGKIELFKKDRPDDINLQLAVGERKGKVTFYIDDQCSSVEEKYSKNYTNKTLVEMDTMSNICKSYVPEGTKIDFCKIDVEGGEKNVLLGYDFINYRPKVFCIESTIPLSQNPNYELWEYILINNDYSYIYSLGVNRFYVDNLIPGLMKRRIYIEKYLKKKYLKIIHKRRHKRRHKHH